ncbi:hypothetical protein N9948_02205 [bacterium]|nr:hypothetical protein [bacterium]
MSFALQKCNKKCKTTTNNREYKIARLLSREGGVDCIICMGKCGYGPRRNWQRNLGKMPKYKNINRETIRGKG